MRTEQLECLITVAEKHSINAASEELHLTPQAVSVALKNLEAELDLPLLYKTAKYTYLTDYGKNIVTISKDFFAKIEQVKSSKNTLPPSIEGDINIIASPGVTSGILSTLVCDFATLAPLLKIHVQTMNYLKLLKTLEHTDDTIGMLFFSAENLEYYQNNLGQIFEFFPLFSCQILAQIPLSNPLSAYQKVSLRSICKYPILLCSSDVDKSEIYQFLYQYGQPTKVITEENPTLFFEMVARNMGISFTLMLPFKPALSSPPPFKCSFSDLKRNI